jgi:maltose/maltodextrin transport system substrate-binding protein
MKIRGLFWTMFLAWVLALITLTDMFSLYAVEADADVNSKFQRTGWNSHVKQRYMHPPVFHFTLLENAALYRCRLWEQSAANNSYQAESETSDVDLSSIWEGLPSAGNFQVIAEAPDASRNVIGKTSFQFSKITPFEGPYRDGKGSYLESGFKAALWLLSDQSDVKATQFPALFKSAYIRILTAYARINPGCEKAQEVVKLARKFGESLISESTPNDWAYGNMPMSHHPGCLQTGRAGMVGMAYLDLYAVTRDESFLKAAMRIADTLKKTQLDDGRWYFRVDPKTGKMLEDYTSDQVESILLLDELIRNHKRRDLVETRDKAVRWMLANPCKTFHWQQQWDDVKTLAPYENLEWYDTGLFIEYLLRYATPENSYAKIALDLLYYIDDQFIEWEPSSEYITPGAREQYVCYHVIDWHTAHYIRVCIAFHRHTGDEAYLRKACAMADTLTVIQHPDGFYPTWMKHKPAKDNPGQLQDINYSDTWANCSSYTGEMLMKLGEYLKEIDSLKK